MIGHDALCPSYGVHPMDRLYGTPQYACQCDLIYRVAKREREVLLPLSSTGWIPLETHHERLAEQWEKAEALAEALVVVICDQEAEYLATEAWWEESKRQLDDLITAQLLELRELRREMET